MGIIADLAALARAGMKVDDIKDIINLTKDKPDGKPDDKPDDKTDYKKLYEETKDKLNKVQTEHLRKDTQPKPKDADTIISDLVRNFM